MELEARRKLSHVSLNAQYWPLQGETVPCISNRNWQEFIQQEQEKTFPRSVAAQTMGDWYNSANEKSLYFAPSVFCLRLQQPHPRSIEIFSNFVSLD